MLRASRNRILPLHFQRRLRGQPVPCAERLLRIPTHASSYHLEPFRERILAMLGTVRAHAAVIKLADPVCGMEERSRSGGLERLTPEQVKDRPTKVGTVRMFMDVIRVIVPNPRGWPN